MPVICKAKRTVVYTVNVKLPVIGQPGNMVGFNVRSCDTLSAARDYADQHHMLTGHTYEVWRDGDCYAVVHTSTHNPKFLIAE